MYPTNKLKYREERTLYQLKSGNIVTRAELGADFDARYRLDRLFTIPCISTGFPGNKLN